MCKWLCTVACNLYNVYVNLSSGIDLDLMTAVMRRSVIIVPCAMA